MLTRESLSLQGPWIRFKEASRDLGETGGGDQAPLLLYFQAQPVLVPRDPQLSPRPSLRVGAALAAGLLLLR